VAGRALLLDLEQDGVAVAVEIDPALEMRIGRALERLMSGRTSVTIAHRLSTAENADEVIVVDKGRVVQRGPHAELVTQVGSVYSGLHASWVAQHSQQ
jgi:ABC-type multidrug transport system fused ATPase/permease subunit